MMNLFAHLEGVVSGVCDRLVCEGGLEARYCEGGRERVGLKNKVFAIRDYFKEKKNKKLPYINVDLKPIRDIINHPSVSKTTPGNESVMLTHVDVYGLDIQEVVDAGEQIDRWLNRVCQLTGYPRFMDTQAEIERFQAALATRGPDLSGAETKKF
jgi:hypothetical protein